MPRTKKAGGQVADRRNGRHLELAVVAGSRPDLPADHAYCAGALEAWEGLWADPVVAAQSPADRAIALRWVDALNRYLVLTAEADREPVVEGSTGQSVANPLYGIADRAMRVVESCEKQLGIGPHNRAALGIALMTENKSLSEMAARAAERRPAARDVDDEDPRIIPGALG